MFQILFRKLYSILSSKKMSLILKKEPFKNNTLKLNSIMNQSSFKSAKNRSLVDTTGANIFQLSQQEIHFLNTEENQIYEVSMFVRNVSDKKQEIRLKKPKSSFLTTSLSKDGPIAPGLDCKITVTFDCKDTDAVEDYFTITSENYECDVPIHVMPRAGKLNFEPFVNFGFIRVGASKEVTWKISNKSEVGTNVSLIPAITGKCEINIEPKSCFIEGKCEKEFKFTISSGEQGHCQGVIDIEPKLFSISSVDFVANFCEFTRMISDDEGNALSEIELQPIFCGEEVEVVSNLVNNTPQSCEFRVSRKRGSPNEELNNLITPEEFGRDDSEKLISFAPSEGALEAYESIPLITKIHAKFDENDQQLFCNYILGRVNSQPEEKEWSYTLKAHINDESPLVLYLRGTSMIPKLSLSSTFFDFHQTNTMTRKEKIFKVENFSEKAVKLEFKKSSSYSFSPNTLKLQPNTNKYVTIVFCPKVVGDVNEVVPMVCGQFSFPIKLLGKGVFNNKRKKSGKLQPINALTASKCEEMKVEEMDNTFLENEISHIDNEKKSKYNSSGLDDSSNKSTIHFDQSYVGSVNQSFSGSSFYLTEHKKCRQLRNRHGKEVKIEKGNLNPDHQIEPYSTFPKSQQQERVICKELTPAELTNIMVGPVTIDIGKIFLRSITKKTFHICNFNSKPISIELNINNLESFSDSNEERQILPAQSWGGLGIKFEALKEGDFKHNLQYVLNGKHFFEMMVIGTVIQPTLIASKQEIRFFATEEDKSFEKKESFILTNSFDYEVSFAFKSNENTLYRMAPSEDTISPKSQKIVNIYHRFDQVPELGVKNEEILKLNIKHGKTIDIKCLSFVPECPVICKSQEVNFKQIAIGKVYENKVILKNTSKNFTIYKAQMQPEIEDILSISSRSGSLHGDQMLELTLKLQAFSSMNIDSSIEFLIRGGKKITLPVKANIIQPKIRVEGTGVIDFGSTPIEGNPASKAITLVNDSQIPVDLEFRIGLDSEIYSAFKVSRILDENSSIISPDQPKDKSCNYKGVIVRINAKSKSSLVLEFTPEQVDTYEFTLPLYIFNSAEAIPELQKSCICRGLKNRLMAAEKEVNFGKIIIEQNLESYQKSKTLEIKNPQQEPIQWWVDDSNIYPFSLEQSKGRLEGFEKTNLKIFFYSDVQGDYEKELQFFIDQNEEAAQEYLKVVLKASASFPTLYFDQPYIIMPTAKLGEQSRTTFEIINGGYENINLKHMVLQEFSNIDIDIELKFPEGTNLGVTKKKIKAEVSFKSDKPVSFTVKVNFFDNNNRSFSIPVSGTADNCIYTLVDGEDRQYPQETEKDCLFLKNYLNSIGCFEDSLYEFPRSIFENDLEKMHQLLCFYSSSFDKLKSIVAKNPRFFYSFDYLSEAIKLIKSEGGFLNQIRPEYLLTYEDYIEAIKLRAENNVNVLSNYDVMDEEGFEFENKKAWVTLMYQIFKVYSRMNSVKTKSNAEFWNKFSQRQKIITGWLEQSYLSETKVEYQCKKNVLQELNDSELLSSIIAKYTNIRVLEVYGRQVKGLKEKERRIKNIIETFAQIGINCHCKVDDIMRSNPKEMLLIVEGLYSILPSYLQKGDPINFTCAMGQTITKAIQISNPSKHPITYVAKVQGSKAYSIENESEFVIESKGTHDVKIKYVSNINLNGGSSTLTLTGKASSKFTPSTFIFVLNSQNTGRVSEKNIQVTGQLYEQYDFSVGVQNHFDTDADFKVELISCNPNKSTPNAFFSLHQALKIKKGETTNFNMIFIPLALENHKCQIIFKDPKVGEFQYELTGLVEQPQLSTDVLKIPQVLFTNKAYSLNLNIPTKNDHLLKARRLVEALLERNEKRSNGAKSQPINAEKHFPAVGAVQTFNVKLQPANEMIQLRTDSITIKQTESVQSQDDSKKQEPKIGLEINMKTAVKEASFYLSLSNAAGTDIRKYKVLLSSSYKPLRYELQMKVSINKSITQQLPLVNLGSEPNQYIVNLQTNEASKGMFALDREREVAVPGKSTEVTKLTFKPKFQNTYAAVIRMDNATTGQLIEYEIIGVGEEPEPTVLTFEQEIRKQRVYQVKLPIEKTTKCTVTKFTLENVAYEKSLMLNSSNNNFKFKFTPKSPGSYEGKLIIEDDSKVHAYKVIINARDVIEEEIKIKTIERKVFDGEIRGIPRGTYQVSSQNNLVKATKVFESTEQNQGVFCFKYLATKPEETESVIVFNNDKVGQLSYLLKIKVDEMPEMKLDPFKVELGSRHEELIKFENHQSEPLKIEGACSHPNSFFFEPAQLVVPAHSEIVAKLIFCPSKLQLEEGKIHFTSERGEKWNYHLSGYGMLQSKPYQLEMKAHVGQEKIESISFVNPLQTRVNAYVSLENLGEESAFQLILKSTKFELDYHQELILPIMIRSKLVKPYRCLLSVAISEKMIFKYEITCTTEFWHSEDKTFKIQARVKKEEQVTVELPYLSQEALCPSQGVNLSILSAQDSSKNLLADAVQVLNPQSSIKNRKATFQLHIKAFKPFRTLSYFTAELPNGCKWVQKCEFVFSPPTPDDKIEIVAEMNKPSSTRFKLTNRVKQYAKFKAYFATGAANELNVSPKAGELEPFGRDGTAFDISFAPTIYKKEWKGKLVIQTEDGYWSYQVKGMLPPYLPPIAKSSLKK